jgi:RHS repeat-associated protein
MRVQFVFVCAAWIAPCVSAQTLPAPPVSLIPVVGLEYDAHGNPKRAILAPGVVGYSTTSDYDRLHRLRVITDAKAGVTNLDYNGREDVVQVTDPRRLNTSTPRNGLGDPTSLVSPDTGTASSTYDAAGNLTTRIDSRGVLASYAYDALNRPLSLIFSSNAQRSTVGYGWAYDQVGAGFSNGIGRLTSSTYPAGAARYAYDPQGRIVSVSQDIRLPGQRALFNHIVVYGYNAAGKVISITYPSGRVVRIDQNGGFPVALSLAPNASTAGQYLISQIQFEPFGGVRAWNWHLDTGMQTHERVFDQSGRMVRYPLATVVRDLNYDVLDRISSYSHLDRATGLQTPGALALNQSFVYDELGRVVTVSIGSGAQTADWGYGYDANGNRLSTSFRSNSSATLQLRNHTVASNSNRLQSIDNPTRSFGHDFAGNTISDFPTVPAAAGPNPIRWTATYDLDGRLASMRTTPYSASATSTTSDTLYGYNASGQRIFKQTRWVQTCTSPGVCTYLFQGGLGAFYVYGVQGELLGEYSLTTGIAIREYIWLQGIPVAVVVSDAANPTPSTTQTMFIHADHLNTPRVVVNRAGLMRWSWMAEPFGNNGESNNPQGLGAFSLNLRMPGQYFDAESGLSYNWHRDYDAGVGRYTQSDPIGLAGGINTYGYVGGNPISNVDPTGLRSGARATSSTGGGSCVCQPSASMPTQQQAGWCWHRSARRGYFWTRCGRCRGNAPGCARRLGGCRCNLRWCGCRHSCRWSAGRGSRGAGHRRYVCRQQIRYRPSHVIPAGQSCLDASDH